MEQYIYGVRSTCNDEKLKDKFSASDKATLEQSVKDGQKWLDSHDDASASDYDDKLKELEAKCQPIIIKLSQGQAGGPGGAGADAGEAGKYDREERKSAEGPTVEEVD